MARSTLGSFDSRPQFTREGSVVACKVRSEAYGTGLQDCFLGILAPLGKSFF